MLNLQTKLAVVTQSGHGPSFGPHSSIKVENMNFCTAFEVAAMRPGAEEGRLCLGRERSGRAFIAIRRPRAPLKPQTCAGDKAVPRLHGEGHKLVRAAAAVIGIETGIGRAGETHDVGHIIVGLGV